MNVYMSKETGGGGGCGWDGGKVMNLLFIPLPETAASASAHFPFNSSSSGKSSRVQQVESKSKRQPRFRSESVQPRDLGRTSVTCGGGGGGVQYLWRDECVHDSRGRRDARKRCSKLLLNKSSFIIEPIS